VRNFGEGDEAGHTRTWLRVTPESAGARERPCEYFEDLRQSQEALKEMKSLLLLDPKNDLGSSKMSTYSQLLCEVDPHQTLAVMTGGSDRVSLPS
jgi:hypothetical protein